MPTRLPDLIIIGAMKCATSTLHEQLARRRAFFMSEPKEPNFFNDEALYQGHMDWYAGLFSAAATGQICGESSTHYTKLPTYQNTARRIRQTVPHAKLVYVMRHPIDRLVSHFIHAWTEGESPRDISDAVIENEEYVAYSCYARQLEPFLQEFDKAQILPVFFEHLVSHQLTELERIARFAGDTSDEPFQWHEEVQQTNVSSDRMRKSAIRDKVLSNPLGRRIKDAIPESVRSKIKSHWQMQKRPTLEGEAQTMVREVLTADLNKLSGLLGLKLTLDNFKAVATATQPTWAM